MTKYVCFCDLFLRPLSRFKVTLQGSKSMFFGFYSKSWGVNLQSGIMVFKMALYGYESVKFGFSLKSYLRVTLHGFESMFLDCPQNVDKENMSRN